MNSNQFLLPQSQARHLQRRNLTAMQRQTLTLGHEAAEMEDKLQLLKNRMSQEKEERSRSAKFRWKSEQPGSSDSSALDATGKKKKAGGPHTLPGRTLSSRAPQRQPLTGPCFPVPVPPAEPPRAAQAGRRSRRRGRGCGQAAALIPDPASQDSEVELLEEDPHRPGEGWPPGLLPGGSEQEPSLLDPLPRWRADAAGGLERTAQAVLWTPGSPVSAAAAATQADLSPTGGGGGGQGRALLRVEFTETSLSYLDRLLLKTHRRTSILTGPGLEEQTEPHSGEQNPTRRDSPTEEDLEHLHLCCSLLLAVTTTGGSSEPPVAPLEPCLTIQVLDETFREPEEDLVASQARSKSRKVLHQRALGPKRAPEPSSAAPNLQSSKTPAGQKSSRSRKASSRRVVQGPKSPRTSSLHTEHSPCSSGTSSQAELSAAPCPSPCPCPSSCPVPAELLSQSPASTAEPTSPPPRLVPSPLSFPSPVSTSEDALVESLCSVSLGDHFPPDEDRRQWPQPTHEALPGLLRETGNPQAERTDEEDHLESDGEDVSVDSLEEDMLHGDRRQMPTGKEVMEGRQAEGWEGGREGGQAHLSLPVSAPEELSSPDGSQSASFYLGAECWTPAETDWDPEDRSPSPAGSHPGFRPPEGPTPAPSVGGPARSRAAQEIMDICAVDQVGCEDSDLDEDTAAHILQELEQEHRRMSWSQVSPTDGRACEGLALSSSHGDQRGRGHSPQSRNQKEQKDEAAETDVRVPSLS